MDMELPGFTEKDVEINLKTRFFLFHQKPEEIKKRKDGEWLIRERRELCFSRRFTLQTTLMKTK